MYFLFQPSTRLSLKRKKELDDAEDYNGSEDSDRDVQEEDEIENEPCRVTRIRLTRPRIDEPSTSTYVRDEPSMSEDLGTTRDRENRGNRRRPGRNATRRSKSRSRSSSISSSASSTYLRQQRPTLKSRSKLRSRSRSRSAFNHNSSGDTNAEIGKDTRTKRRARRRISKSPPDSSSSGSAGENGTPVQRARQLSLKKPSNFKRLLKKTGCKVS